MRHHNKALLGNALTGITNKKYKKGKKRKHNESEEWDEFSAEEREDLQASKKWRYVLDGGALLHRINWRGATFDIVENAKM